ncbi:uncharacterized protein BXZ73DRAFT_22181, partial [Epithele typhae]|uniref:uncharacterized protein n=1 Tax=Epithele typhae TaxID=378194 RepID=UPI002008130D
RLIVLRRSKRPLRDFFWANPQPDVPARPQTVPRTTGLPSISGPPASVIYATLPMPPAALADRQRRRRRTRGGDIDAGGRRGRLAHPDDPDEFLPVYDDKDVLPKYQDVEQMSGGGSRMGALRGLVGLGHGSAEQRRSRTGDTIPLVETAALAPSSTTLDRQPVSSVGSHEALHDMQELTAD